MTTLLLLAGCELLPFLSDDALNARYDLDDDGVARPDDCDDDDPSVGVVKQYADVDHDGYGYGVTIEKCGEITGYAMHDGDCDDQDATVNPGADEVCNGIDDDCNGIIDTDAAIVMWYADADEDGYGDSNVMIEDCSQPAGYVANATDCDDALDSVNPGAYESCNTIDDDCDGTTDEDDAVDAITWYLDSDADTFGDAISTDIDCDQPAGYVADATDCEDTNAAVNPNAEEICDNGIDDDCDGGPNDCGFNGEVLTSEAETTITGDAADDSTGWAVSLSGDLDGDGTNDLIVASPYANMSTKDDGIICAFLTVPTGSVSCSSGDVVITGVITSDAFGRSMATGDLEGDGDAELLVGATGQDDGATNGGAIYLFHPDTSMVSADEADLILLGEASNDNAGSAAAVVSDTDGDGIADLFVAAYAADTDILTNSGAAYLVSGTETGSFSLGETLRIDGEYADDYLGWAIASADLNGDGTTDLVITAYGSDLGATDAGAVYGLYGPFGSTISLADDSAFILVGDASEDRVGVSLANAADTDGDGTEDLLIGAFLDDTAAASAGAAYLILTKPTGTVSVNVSTSLTLLGESADDNAGCAVAAGTDTDLDGTPDLIVGAFQHDGGAGEGGATYIVSGVERGTTSLSAASTTVLGDSTSQRSGYSLSQGADINGDGLIDVLLGANNSALFFYNSLGL